MKKILLSFCALFIAGSVSVAHAEIRELTDPSYIRDLRESWKEFGSCIRHSLGGPVPNLEEFPEGVSFFAQVRFATLQVTYSFDTREDAEALKDEFLNLPAKYPVNPLTLRWYYVSGK